MTSWPLTVGLGSAPDILNYGLTGLPGQFSPAVGSGYDPAVSDMILEAFERIEIRPTSLTRHQLRSAYRSINYAFSTWANRGVNLWEIDLLSIPMIQGQIAYNLPADTVMIRDVYLRTYEMGNPVSLTCAFSTTINTPLINIGWPNHGQQVGSWVNVVMPVSVGGVILYAFYQVTAVPDLNTITIDAGINATATVVAGGAVPVFTTTAGSANITVTLANHGLSAGSTFPVEIQTTVSDIVLFGNYTVSAVIDANTLVFPGPNAAFADATVAENGGLFQITGQSVGAQPVDRLLYPMSRNDYAAIPNKFQQGTVNSFWFDRTSPIPIMNMYLAPSNTGPQVMMIYRSKQIATASLQNGATPDIPYRALEACVSDLAARLAQKFAPAKWPMMAAEAKAQWKEFADEDTERVSLYISGDVSGYWNA